MPPFHRNFFDLILARDDVKKSKPHPEGLELAHQLTNAKLTIYIGDAWVDAKAAENANIPYIGYQIDKDRFRETNSPIPEFQVETLEDIPMQINSILKRFEDQL